MLLLLPLLQTATATVAAAPCDIYKGAGTPCAAAHSVVRALFAAGRRPLYQLRRYGDNATLDIYALPAAHGGVANASAHTDFCSEPHPPPPPPTPYPPHWPGGGYPARADCVVSIIYDQTGNGNHLLPATPVRIARIRPSAAHSVSPPLPRAAAPTVFSMPTVRRQSTTPPTICLSTRPGTRSPWVGTRRTGRTSRLAWATARRIRRLWRLAMRQRRSVRCVRVSVWIVLLARSSCRYDTLW